MSGEGMTFWTQVKPGDLHISIEGITNPKRALCGATMFTNDLSVGVVVQGTTPMRASCQGCAEKLYQLISDGKVKVSLV